MLRTIFFYKMATSVALPLPNCLLCSNVRLETWIWPNAVKPMLYREANAVPWSKCCTAKQMLYHDMIRTIFFYKMATSVALPLSNCLLCSNVRLETWIWPNAVKPMLYRKADAVPRSRCGTAKQMRYREADALPWSRCCTKKPKRQCCTSSQEDVHKWLV